jgi:thiol-disulfide isomerase/thioredoxin
MNKRRLIVGSVISLAALVGGGWLAASRLRSASPDPVKTLFGLTFNDADARSISLAQYQGKPLVVNFWATWCPPCIEEMPELSEWQTTVGDKIAIVGIGIDSATNIAQFSAKNRLKYPLLVAGMGGTELSRLFGNTSGSLPFTIIINAAGKIIYTKEGRFSLAEMKNKLALSS